MLSRIYWTRQSREDLREVHAFISRDAPATSSAFVRRLRESVSRLKEFPESGQVVPELGRKISANSYGETIESFTASAETVSTFSPSTTARDSWTRTAFDRAYLDKPATHQLTTAVKHTAGNFAHLQRLGFFPDAEHTLLWP